jgi:hypothetical protein
MVPGRLTFPLYQGNHRTTEKHSFSKAERCMSATLPWQQAVASGWLDGCHVLLFVLIQSTVRHDHTQYAHNGRPQPVSLSACQGHQLGHTSSPDPGQQAAMSHLNNNKMLLMGKRIMKASKSNARQVCLAIRAWLLIMTNM